MIKIGQENKLKIVRKSDLGYMASDGKNEILIHYREALTELEIGQSYDIYVYTDKENRPTGTQKRPKILIGESDFLEVVEVKEAVGVYVFNNTPKDLLLSKDYLPYSEDQWPKVGDKIFCELKIKHESLMAKPLNRYDIKSLHSQVKYALKEQTQAYVIRVALKGLGLITVDHLYVFVPNTQFRGSYRLGQEVKVTITKMLDGEAYGMLNAQKETLMKSDEEVILNYLKENGTMPLTAKSSSEEVIAIFNMSRKAFKRAYGALYKSKQIDFDESKTFLTKK